ncbi:MAG TPA: lysophospholipid acyltransferase family protein [Spirochaetota bacterium]|nr:lysophospholipid acyltransferase family protein [Spirochaetota bacterium]HPV40606.1 lysophospholipid acyltransferase family protein [Spirochaetota bacterium]
MRHVKPVYYLYQVYKYGAFLPLLVLSTLFFAGCGLLLRALAGDRAASRMGAAWARFNSYLTPMFVDVLQTSTVDRDRSYVIVANHQSSYDIFVVYGWMPFDFRWVMKAELRDTPVLGYFCDRIGHIFVDRSDTEAAKKSINDARRRIGNGTSVMFFPEGTWSPDGELLEFKKGAFRLALDMRLPVLPVTIVDTRRILPSDTTALFPGRAKLVIHEPIEIDGYHDGNMHELMQRARDAIQKGLVEHHEYN